MTHHEFVLSMLRLVEGDEQQSLLVILSLLHKILYLLRNGAIAAQSAKLEGLSQTKRTSKQGRSDGVVHVQDSKPANVQDAPGAPTQPSGWDWCAEQVLKQGDQLEQLLRMLEGGGGGDRSRSTTPPPPPPPAAVRHATTGQTSPERLPRPPATLGLHPGDAAQMRQTLSGLTPRRSSPVRQAVLRQVECLQDYATNRPHGPEQGV